MPPPPEIQRVPRDAVTLQPDPPLDFSDADYLNNPALSRDDVKLLREFHNAAKQELCARCNALWFDMDLKDNVCGCCRRADKSRDDNAPFLYSAANDMDRPSQY